MERASLLIRLLLHGQQDRKEAIQIRAEKKDDTA